MEEKSVAIFDILDKLGVNTDFVSWCRRNAEAINAFDYLKYRIYGVDLESRAIGSFSDGSFREWLRSDLDTLHIYNHGLVFEDPDSNCIQDGQFHWMFTDETMQPGYVKLEVQHKNVNLTSRHNSQNYTEPNQGFIFHKTDSFALKVLKTNQRTKGSDFIYKVASHGPAEANISPSLANVEENVFAYRCGCVPRVAKEWLQRCRSFSWPSSNDLEKLEQIPCHVVPMGHPHSDNRERELQWKMSFTLHEQYLMTRLNETQLKCFFLLKVIKEEVIKPGTRDFIKDKYNKGFKTYHCKTALLYTIQTNDQISWVPENLIGCLLLCLDRLLQWLENGFCPDFYIPKANLLDGKIEDDSHKRKIIQLLKDFIKDPVDGMCSINVPNFGRLFMKTLFSDQKVVQQLNDDIEKDTAEHIFYYLTKIAVSGFDLCGYSLYYISENSKDISDAVKNHIYVMELMQNFLEDQDQDIRSSLQQALAYLHTSLASHLTVQANKSGPIMKTWYTLAADFHFEKGFEQNKASSMLKYATVLLMTGHQEKARQILDDFDTNFDHNTQCINFGMAAPTSDKEKNFCIGRLRGVGLKTILNMPCSILLQQFLSAPVLFLPTEIDITPDALKFEMFRTIATAPGSMVPHLQYWYKWASVDVSVMSPFLKYVAKHGMDLHSLVAVLNATVSMDNYETPQNLLGWAAMHENETCLAIRHFMESWRICSRRTEQLSDVFKIEKQYLNEHNAAKLWMLVLMHRQIEKSAKDTVLKEETLQTLYTRK